MTKSTQVILALAMLSLALFLVWLMVPHSTSLPGLAVLPGSEKEQVQVGAGIADPGVLSRRVVSDTATGLSGANSPSSPANSRTSTALNSGSAEHGRVQWQLSALQDEVQRNTQTGQRSIAGLVQDEDGNPLANIEVRAGLIKPPGDAGLEEDLHHSGEQSTWTRTDGLFVFNELVDGEYRLHTTPDDHFAPAETKARPGVMSANLVLMRQRVVRLFGVVSSEEGKPLDEVRVVAGPPTRVTDSDHQGVYELDISIKGKNRPHTIHFRREGFRDQSVRLDPIELDEMFDYFELDIAMEPLEGLTTVSGRLMDPDGHPVSGIIVNMRSPELRNSYRAQSDVKGHFSLDGVEPGQDYQLSVRTGAGFRDYQQSHLQIPASGLQLDIVLEPLEQGEVSGFMTDANGRPISGFAMTLQSKTAAGRSIQVIGDSIGFFNVKEFPTGSAVLKTNSYPVFETQGFNVSPELEEPVSVVLDVGPQALFGRVESVLGETVAASEVSLSWKHSEHGMQNYSARKTTADQNGNFIFTGLGPGEHTLRVNAPGFSMAIVTINVGMDPDNIVVELSEKS